MSTITTAQLGQNPTPLLKRLFLCRCGAALFLISFMSFFIWKLFSAHPIDHLHYPAQSSARIFERHLYFYEGFGAVSPLEERTYTFLFGSRRETLQEAAQAYGELLQYFVHRKAGIEEWNQRNTQLRYIITLAELGRWDQFIQQLDILGDMPEEAVLQNLLYYAYDQTEDDIYMPEIHAGIRMLPTGWSKDYISYRVYKRAGMAEETRWAHGNLLRIGNNIRHDLASTIVFLIVFMSISFIALLMMRNNALIRLSIQGGVYDQPWTLSQGVRLLLYAACLGVMLFYLTGLTAIYLAIPWLGQCGLLIASIPMFVMAQYYFLGPRKLNIFSGYGLRITPAQIGALLLTTLVVIGVERSGSYAIAWLVSVIGLNPHWAAGISETWLWGKPDTIRLGAINAILVAPLVEEFGFRGLLFVSLRSRFSFKTAALLSAILFALFHGGSLVGFLTAFWSGLVWALALERTRSLLPGIISHIVANSLAVYMVLTFYN